MLSNRPAFAALALACIGAAGAGGYLASRQNVVPAPASAQIQPSPAPDAARNSAVEPPAPPVQETEAVVGDASFPRANTPKPSAVKRPEPLRACRC